MGEGGSGGEVGSGSGMDGEGVAPLPTVVITSVRCVIRKPAIAYLVRRSGGGCGGCGGGCGAAMAEGRRWP